MSGYFDRLLARAAGAAADALPALPLAFVADAEFEPTVAATPGEIAHAAVIERDPEPPAPEHVAPTAAMVAAPQAPEPFPADPPPLQPQLPALTPLPSLSAVPPPLAGQSAGALPLPPTPAPILPLRRAPPRDVAAPQVPIPPRGSPPTPVQAPEPDVQITIGRIDIVVPSPAAPAAHDAAPTERQRDETGLPLLADYLKARAAR